MILDNGKWNSRIKQINNAEISKFKKYIEDNPYRPISLNDDYNAYIETMALAQKRLSKLGEYGEICLNIIARELKIYDEGKIQKRSEFIRYLTRQNKIDFQEIITKTQEFIIPKLQMRENEIKIRWIDGNIIAQYPHLNALDNDFKTISFENKGFKDLSGEIINGYLNALKIMIIHPYIDGNGRIARLIATASLVNALNLQYIPFLEPFLRARNNNIAQTIQSFLENGDVTPFLFAFSGAMRDGLELTRF